MPSTPAAPTPGPWRQRLGAGFDAVELWLIDLTLPIGAADPQWLSDAERARARRFVAERHRRRYERAHLALRTLLGERCGIEPGRLAIEADASGKPRIADPRACRFNLSHSEDQALIALCDGIEVGVDIERLRPVPDTDALVASVCSPAERALWPALAGAPGATAAFLRCWTRKEACLKAVGVGLGIAPSRVEVGFDAAPRGVVVPCPGAAVEVALRSVAVDGGWVAAVACA